MMRSLLLMVCFLGVFCGAQAQKRQKTYFLRNDGKKVDIIDSADFVRIIEEPDSGSAYFKLKEYYLNNKIKTIGEVSYFEPVPVYEGAVGRYDGHGKKESTLTYKSGKLTGLGYFFYTSGTLKKVMDFDSNKLNYFTDSLGSVMVKDGNGHILERVKDPFGAEFIEEGDYVDGQKDGVHVRKNLSGTYWLKEQFAAGKFVSGESFKDGKSYTFSVIEKAPAFKGGIQSFYKYLSSSIKYPKDAEAMRATGQVFVGFVVDVDGRLVDVKVERSVFPSLDSEAVRMIKSSPKWEPAVLRGIPARVKMVIPVNFTLNPR